MSLFALMWIYITHMTGLNIFKMSRQSPRSGQYIQDPRSGQDIQDEIQDLTKKFKNSMFC